MDKAKSFISKLLYNKFLWQLIFSSFLIGMAVFFIRHENIELSGIRDQLSGSNPWYVALGILLTCVYITFQGQMYAHSYKALGLTIPLKVAFRLFLKRNFISIFLPAGGFSSLAFFTGEVESRGASKSQIHLASTLFAFFSILSVVVISFPIFGFALLRYKLHKPELYGFLFLILMIVCFFVFLLQGTRRAWYIGLFLTVISVVGHLMKGADYEEAILALIAAVSLIYTRAHYTLKPHRRLMRISYYVLLYSGGSSASVWYYGLLFY